MLATISETKEPGNKLLEATKHYFNWINICDKGCYKY